MAKKTLLEQVAQRSDTALSIFHSAHSELEAANELARKAREHHIGEAARIREESGAEAQRILDEADAKIAQHHGHADAARETLKRNEKVASNLAAILAK